MAIKKFQKGSGCYVCRACKKQTRETGEGEAGAAEIVHQDGGHDEPLHGCRECLDGLGYNVPDSDIYRSIWANPFEDGDGAEGAEVIAGPTEDAVREDVEVAHQEIEGCGGRIQSVEYHFPS